MYIYAYSILLMTIFLCYLGFFNHNDSFDGYGLPNFIYLYMLGNLVRKYNFELSKLKSFLLYVLCSLSVFICYIFLTCINTSNFALYYYILSYNNPFIIIGSISIFLFFLNFHFYDMTINYIAKSVLCIYLLHSGAELLVYKNDIDPLLYSLYVNNDSVIFGFYMVIYVIILFFVGFVASYALNFITNPVVNVLDKIIKSTLKKNLNV